jgi:alpha-glucosidase
VPGPAAVGRQRAGARVHRGYAWLPIPPEWSDRTVARQLADGGSTLQLFRAALPRRPLGAFAWRESPAGTLVFSRGDVVCSVNVSAEPLPLEGQLLLASEPVAAALPAGAAAWTR